MRQWVYDFWNSVMDSNRNPLRNIPDLATRHMIMQVLACIAFGIIVGSMWAGVFSMMLHSLLLAALVVTIATFETAKRKPSLFRLYSGRSRDGEHE
jgi:tetrahydromethanopterin S-methyltransferase subunit B